MYLTKDGWSSSCVVNPGTGSASILLLVEVVVVVEVGILEVIVEAVHQGQESPYFTFQANVRGWTKNSTLPRKSIFKVSLRIH